MLNECSQMEQNNSESQRCNHDGICGVRDETEETSPRVTREYYLQDQLDHAQSRQVDWKSDAIVN